MTKKTALQVVEPVPAAERLAPAELQLGDWYWIKDNDNRRRGNGGTWFACITRKGSNHVEFTGVSGHHQRVHLDDFDATCRFEADPERVIAEKTAVHQAQALAIMQEVVALTQRLGVHPSPELGQTSEVRALALASEGQNADAYKHALVQAKTKTLPDLFSKLKNQHELVAQWLSAGTVPFKAEVERMQKAVEKIDDRIFNVELYAGLSERVTKISDGEPAEITAKIHLMQRRCYMDEECLARYRTGGMTFREIGDFDAWLAQPENRDRIMPFPRSVVAFRVRRHTQEVPEFGRMIDMYRLINDAKLNQTTFLYIRNGERLYRMSVAVDLNEMLFPDMDARRHATELKWAKTFAGHVRDELISDEQFQGLLEEYLQKKRAYDLHKKAEAAWRAEGADPKKYPERDSGLYFLSDPRAEYVPYEPNNIYYDDVSEHLAKQMQEHNRIAMILQGVLDRSDMLHPHPPWKLWDQRNFEMAIELVYDQSRALPGTIVPPSFEDYRARLNATLRKGSVTVGQKRAWRAARLAQQEYVSDSAGPDYLHVVSDYKRRTKRCSYTWTRDGRWDGANDEYRKVRVGFECSADAVLNADAYTPGDFRMFFDDPRTRADYMKWAPLLLECEEYHAGNREVTPALLPKKRAPASRESALKYARQKRMKQMIGKIVRFLDDVRTDGGTIHPMGSLWRVYSSKASGIAVVGVNADGTDAVPKKVVTRMMDWGVEIVDPQPPPPPTEDETAGSTP